MQRWTVGLLERPAAVQAAVAQPLRQRLERPAELAHRPLLAAHHREHLQPGEQAVAGRGEVGHDDVAGLLAAEVVARGAHLLDHVAVADLGAVQASARGSAGSARGRGSTSWWRPRRRRAAGRRPASSGRAGPGSGRRRSARRARRPARCGRHRRRARCRDRRRARAPRAHIACGWVEPQRALMLKPLGLVPSSMTSAPSSHSTFGRDAVGRAVGAVDHDLEAVQASCRAAGWP